LVAFPAGADEVTELKAIQVKAMEVIGHEEDRPRKKF
jgi:hypothetical protein